MIFLELAKNISKVFFLTSFLVVTIGLILYYLPKEIAERLVEENGLIESLQVILYIVGAIICFSYTLLKIWDKGLSAAYLLTMLAFRELDFQVKFTEISITRTKFYFSPDISITAKILGGIVVFSILIVLIRFAWKNLSRLINGITNRKIWSILTMNGILFIIIAMVFDRSLTILTLIGIEGTIKMELEKSFFEEAIELVMPISFTIALITYGISCYKDKKTAQEMSDMINIKANHDRKVGIEAPNDCLTAVPPGQKGKS